ncbi:hypothetical protein B9479_003596 [Cryptococcus floricola]|uniref:Uncharacterized protein n=1 Tax=Cryptococcus floricola TaxID=2591691 RepID=A0A5D3AXW0_9TREE|nr:hypothetical protein B9479_003596 [Cryptococcus floricola]
MLRTPLRRALRLPRVNAITPQRRFAHALPTDLPPIRARLRPLVPFFIYWTIITSLLVHLLRTRQESGESLSRQKAKISVLGDLIARIRNGEDVSEEEMQREMEMVGLRERTALTLGLDKELKEAENVGWREVLLGKTAQSEEQAAREEKAIEEWAQLMNGSEPQAGPEAEAEAETRGPSIRSLLRPSERRQEGEREGMAERAPGSSVYL